MMDSRYDCLLVYEKISLHLMGLAAWKPRGRIEEKPANYRNYNRFKNAIGQLAEMIDSSCDFSGIDILSTESVHKFPECANSSGLLLSNRSPLSNFA